MKDIKRMENKKIRLALAGLIIIVMIVAIITVLNNKSDRSAKDTFKPTKLNDKQLQELPRQFSDLGALHVQLLAKATRSQFDGTESIKDDKAALAKNSAAFADIIGNIYGKSSRDSFLTLWNNHNDTFMKYTAAMKFRNTPERLKALDELKAFNDSFGEYMNLRIPSYSKAAATQDVSFYTTQIKIAIDGYVLNTNPTASKTALDNAVLTMNKFQSQLSSQVTQQNKSL